MKTNRQLKFSVINYSNRVHMLHFCKQDFEEILKKFLLDKSLNIFQKIFMSIYVLPVKMQGFSVRGLCLHV